MMKRRKEKMELKCSKETKPTSLGFVIHKNYKKEPIEILVVGASAVNQAIKAIAFANRFYGMKMTIAPFIKTIEIDGEIRHAMCLKVI